jgi:hypothetical protein
LPLGTRSRAATARIEVQATFPLTHAHDALAAFGAGTRGKLVLTIR